MPFQTIEVQRLYQQVAEQIGGLIRSGEFRDGDRLPPERDLARQLGVSRPVVREAMIALEIAGYVEVRGGAGAFVRRSRTGARSELAAVGDPGPSPFDLIAARRMLEGEIAFCAAADASPDDLRSVREAVELMRADIASNRDTRQSDRLFHIRVAAVTRNAVLIGLVDELWGHMLAPIFDVLGRHTGLPGRDRMTLQDHEAIVEALARRDPESARKAMQDHLAHVQEILLRDDLDAIDPASAASPRRPGRGGPRQQGRRRQA